MVLSNAAVSEYLGMGGVRSQHQGKKAYNAFGAGREPEDRYGIASILRGECWKDEDIYEKKSKEKEVR